MSKIFVSIASYRDPQTGPTISDLVEKAKNKDDITIGLCLQHDTNEIKIDPKYHKNLKILDYDWRESQGTCWARHNIQKELYSGEDYYLQLDSHHRFCESWDAELISIHDELCKNYNKPIIGGYCPSYKPEDDTNLEDKPMQINSFSDFTDAGDLMFVPKTIRSYKELQNNNTITIPARFLSGHFIFSHGIFCSDCIYDPNLYFRGEELSLSARAYTSGYDFFHPTKPIVWHEYIREKQIKHWTDHTTENGFLTTWHSRSEKGKERARYLLGIEKNKKINFNKYGLGKIRSIHEYELYAGLRFSTKQVHKYAYDLNNVYDYAKILDENEWLSGLMQKYKIQTDIPANYLSDLKKMTTLKHVSLFFDDKTNKACYRKDIKISDLHILNTKYYIEASMEKDPVHAYLIPYTNDKGFLTKQKINYKILP